MTIFCHCGFAQQAVTPGTGFAAVPEKRGGQDITGPYDVVRDWPADLTTLPGHEDWTWGAIRGVLAESEDRIFVLQINEQPKLDRPKSRFLPEVGASSIFPIARLPWRSARGGEWDRVDGGSGKDGIDTRAEHHIVVLNAEGNVIEQWSQWDELVTSPHAIHINPYDPDRHIWIIDDRRHAIFKFTNDGKKLVQTLGVIDERGTDSEHFSWPTYMAWLPDGSFFVADGGMFFEKGSPISSRVVKFDKQGNYLMDWGKEGSPPGESRPGFFNNVHGIAVDAQTRRVFVNDRQNHRVQVFTEFGEFLDQWSFGDERSDIHLFIITAERELWAVDRGTNRILKYTLDGHLLYAWGTWGSFPGEFWSVHGISVDPQGAFYVAEVDNGRIQKFQPREGANSKFLVGQAAH